MGHQELPDQSELQSGHVLKMKRLLILVLALLVPSPLAAQQNNANQAQLRLVIVDQTGAGIPNATIVVTPESGAAVTFSSDNRGLATAPALTPGPATVKVEFP